MPELLSFLVVILAGVIFSAIFNRLHLPWVVALIVAGIVAGPFGLRLITPTPTLEFFAQIGLIFLMFMAGLETRLSAFRELRGKIIRLAFPSAVIPFFVGWGIALFFGFTGTPALLLGIIFMSSSIAVVVPSLEATGLIETRFGKSVVGAVIAADVLSLLLLSMLLQTVSPVTRIPLVLFYPMLAGLLIMLRWAVPRLRRLLVAAGRTRDIFEQDIRFVFAFLIATVVLFELLGLHAILAGFLAGLLLSELITSKILQEKLHAVSYGLFIPVFFVVVGAKTDLSVFTEAGGALTLTAAIIAGSILSKFVSGWFGARLSGFTRKERVVAGVSMLPQLSTTLAVVFTAHALGMLDDHMLSAMIMLSIITTLISPVLIRHYAEKLGGGGRLMEALVRPDEAT